MPSTCRRLSRRSELQRRDASSVCRHRRAKGADETPVEEPSGTSTASLSTSSRHFDCRHEFTNRALAVAARLRKSARPLSPIKRRPPASRPRLCCSDSRGARHLLHARPLAPRRCGQPRSLVDRVARQGRIRQTAKSDCIRTSLRGYDRHPPATRPLAPRQRG